MAYYGYQFVFDGVSSKEFGMIIYDLSGQKEDGIFTSAPTKIFEDRTVWRDTPLHYGVSRNTPLTFTLTFGVLPDNHQAWISRWEMDVIATWLTGHNEYKYLEIVQPDMEAMRYKCMITDLKYTTYGKYPWAFSCTVTCDSPFAYLYPEIITHSVTGSLRTVFENRASSIYYRPSLTITLTRGNSISIINHSDHDREFALSNIKSRPIVITVDNENEIITNDLDLNLYDDFNYKFFRLVRGRNDLELTAASAVVNYFCEFPINIGG